MTPLPISAEARGAVRTFKANLRRADARFQAKFESLDANRAAERYTNCGAMGRARALRRLRALFGPADSYVEHTPIWAHLRPREAVIVTKQDPGQAQDAVVLEYITVASGALESGLWTLEVPDHALARAAQRCRGMNLRNVMIDAHRNLLTVRCDPLPQGDVLVRAGPGAFVGQMVYGRELRAREAIVIYFRPRTWLHEDQLTRPLLDDTGSGSSWGTGPLLPFPMRSITLDGEHLNVRRRVG